MDDKRYAVLIDSDNISSKYISDIYLNIHLLQLRQYSVSSARIHQHQGAGSLEHKTGIINLGNRSISRSEHRNLSRCLIPCLIRYLFDSRPQNYSFSDKPPRKSPENFAYSK